jgi:hypothetical protein
MRYGLRTLLILMTVLPPVIGFWPSIQRRVVARVTQVTACDAAVVTATASLIAIRTRVYLAQVDQRLTNEEDSAAGSKQRDT